ncbi:ATP-grasp fold amidoligase family protein [Stutzerimonas stutzeri]|uniref:ATP-grasp fold amidoligase family protein n=1 Tax=Stutzerimonas stutzeri TaxID=316 RepID=UPI003B7F0B18
MGFIKDVIRYLYRNVAFLRSWWFLYQFVKKNRYWPNFKNPKTYNEKVNYRKNNPKHELFSICSDKIGAKEWVAERIGEEYIIPNYFLGGSITPEKIKEILAEKGDCLLKANHNSGPVYLLTTASSEDEISAACKDVNEQLLMDYGKLSNEPWYSKIKPMVLVEKRLDPEPGETNLRDYKFHVFKQADGSFKTILEVHFDQGVNHNISYFDQDLNWLPITVEYPNIVTKITKPVNYELMLEKAKVLARDFTHVRVDFYNVDGSIYFGELTFAKTSGGAIFMHKMYDLWMGNLWVGDPSY